MGRKEISQSQRDDAVHLVVAEGHTVRQVCQLMDVGPTALRRWLAIHEEAKSTGVHAPTAADDRRRIVELESQVLQLKEERELFKKIHRLLRSGERSPTAVIDELKEAYPVSRLCEAMEYPRSSYYAKRAEEVQPAVADPALVARVKQIHRQSRGSYGTRRMAAELGRQGMPTGRYRARTLMRQAGLWAERVRRHVYRTASKAAVPAPNRLERQFNVARPDQVWVGDITFVPTRQGWLYLAVVVDLYARRIVGWAFSTRPNAQLAVAALDMAIRERKPSGNLMFHSDQGAQYNSFDFLGRLKALGITQSMSRRGNCWDNAVAERVFATLKTEWVTSTYSNRDEAQSDITVFLTSYYNYRRLHAANGQVPPAIYEMMAARK
ncbi:IS3 family transposase [Luteibacter sp. 9135]|uniref:IS3 family transposase n=1 Tax=Luteibacter sp. 9135 TaxID=1500893 RepID=UPI00163A9A80|nr:IS3 family transposase [Luteibacter sp. 9135]